MRTVIRLVSRLGAQVLTILIQPAIVAIAAPAQDTAPNHIKEIPEFWKISDLHRIPTPDRIVFHHSDSRTTTVVSVMDHYLDLPYQLRHNTFRGGPPLVPSAPPMVVGEGPHKDNHTIVKILNKYGLADITFLAYPPCIKGGVHVAAGRDASKATVIATTPIASVDTNEIRLFNRHGGFIGSLAPDAPPPHVISIGDFLPRTGDELAVCSRTPEAASSLAVYSLSGNLIETHSLPTGIKGDVRLSSIRADSGKSRSANLMLFSTGSGTAWKWSLDNQPIPLRNLPLDGKMGISADAYSNRLLLLEPGSVVSTMTAADPATNAVERLTVSEYENRFWVVTPPPDIEPKPNKSFHPPNLELARMKEGRYVRFCKYGHMRLDAASPGYRNPPFGSPDMAAWIKDVQAPDLSTTRVTMWEPCFTHRGFPQLLGKWAAARDPVSGLPKYMMVARDNALDAYKEGEGGAFSLTSYALDVPDLDNMYLNSLSAFLRNLAVRFREHPELMPSLEPNHENEIPLKHAGTRGDYNPFMVQGFYSYLSRMYGNDPDTINHALGTPFTEYFDAPRNMGRGDWDVYDMANPFFREWRNYNRLVVNARLAQGFRESLQAGFPPELIKAHQIPGIYFGGEMSFSKVKTRITPIDYVVSAGIGGGYTRYGVWYRNKYNFLQGSHSSGHDSVAVGEYNSLTGSNEHAAKQLTYMFDHGVMGVHVMGWRNDAFNRTMSHAVRELITQDRPRPGGAGGVADLKPFVDGDRRFNVAVLGAGPGKVGLLKSLKEDGMWEGSVYVAPFKAHTDIEEIKHVDGLTLKQDDSFGVGPIDGLNGGSQIELTFQVKGTGSLHYGVYRNGTVLPGLSRVIKYGDGVKYCRIIHRTQVPTDGIALRLDAIDEPVEIASFSAVRHITRFANVYRGVKAGQRHEGGITFDFIP